MVLLAGLIAVLMGIAPFSAAAQESLKGQVLYEGPVDPACLSYAEEIPEEGMDSGWAIRLLPDSWHRPVLRLYFGGQKRMDFRPFDTLLLHVKGIDPALQDQTVTLKTWDRSSRTVSIKNYLNGNAQDENWQQAAIPLTDLTTDDWDLSNVEAIAFGKDPNRRTLLLDRVCLVKKDGPVAITDGKDAPFPETNQVLRLAFDRPFLKESARQMACYLLTSSTDPAYQTPANPVNLGIQSQLKGFSESGGAIMRNHVFIRFAAPFQNGHCYCLEAQGITDDFGNPMPPASYDFVYDDQQLRNPNIKINQIGYHPDRPKRGYVGGYAGDLGGRVWAVGEGGLVLEMNQSGQWDQAPSLTEATLRAVCATREDDVWAVGDAGVIIHGDGSEWQQIPSPTSRNLHAIHFGPTGIGWAVGDAGTTLRYEKQSWRQVSAPTAATLRGVWAGPQDTAWAVGDTGAVLRWTGMEWTAEAFPTTATLHSVHGPHADWLWAVGEAGTVLRRRHGRWTPFESTPGTSVSLRSVTASLTGDVWIVGDQGLLWYKKNFGSSGFTSLQSGTAKRLLGVARQEEGRMWAVGENGLFLKGAASSWEPVDPPISTSIHGVFALCPGPIRLPSVLPQISILDVLTSAPVLRLPLKLHAANWPFSGEDVYIFDFSCLTTPGTYQAYVPGIGLSDPFVVNTGVLKEPARTLARGLYYQRCGAELSGAFAGDHARPLCHRQGSACGRADALIHASLLFSPLYAGETPKEMLDVSGGWHDAGDYGKYIPTAAAALWHLLTAYELNPKAFSDGDLGIPESGNGVPDILDETRWELDWICRMQHASGGVYHKVTSEAWFKGMPHQKDGPRYIFEMTTHDTAMAAAVLAMAARIWQDLDTEASRAFLERAERAWEFLKRHPDPLPAQGFRNPKGVVTGEYNDSEDGDNRLWAAAELYRTTGKKVYENWFGSWWNRNDHSWGWSPWRHAYPYAVWAYLQSPWPYADQNIQKEIREQLLRKAQESLDRIHVQPYSSAARLDVPEQIGWGSFSQSAEAAFLLLQAWRMTQDDRYLDGAFQTLDVQFGANPLSMCFVTGMGSRSPRDPLHMPSLYDGVEAPVPGIPVFGAAAHLSQTNPFYRAAQDPAILYPSGQIPADPYPILRRYWDAHELVPMSEFTIVDMAIAAGALGVLSHP
jgi:hypothetical protein